MRTVRYDIKLTILGLLQSFLIFAHAAAGSNPEIKVREVIPTIRENKLFVNVRIENLFSPKVVGTIQSGLPSVVFVELTLQEINGRRILRKRILQSISYNIWEERYTIQRDSTEESLQDFSLVKEHSSTIKEIYLIGARFLRAGAKYSVKVRAGISPISSLQSEKLSSWLQESDETQSDIVAQERSSGFKFNLSKLVSILVGGNKRSGNSSPEHVFEFRLADIERKYTR
ncbi:MAG: DUF4390 domain-containing protein [bacterium]